MSKSGFRQGLSISGLLKEVRQSFEKTPDTKSNCTIPLADHVSSLKHRATCSTALQLRSIIDTNKDVLAG